MKTFPSNPRAWEMVTEEYQKFKATLGYMRPCLKKYKGLRTRGN